MTAPSKYDFPPPMGDKQINKLIAQINRKEHIQDTAADLAAAHLWTAEWDGEIGDIIVSVGAACAAGESMTFDIFKNGVSILSAVITIDSTTAKYVNGYSKLSTKTFVAGDVFTCTRDYTAGGGPTPTLDSMVAIEPTIGSFRYLEVRHGPAQQAVS